MLKKKVLKVLEENKGSALSGEEIAVMLGVSRSAVWKAVKSLKAEGHEIEAITNKGYTLSEQSDILSEEGISLLLENKASVTVLNETTSTNDIAKIKVIEKVNHGSVVVANSQTAGRGRRGRSFFSPKDSGVYFSIILRPKVSPEKCVLLTSATAVAVCEAIEELTSQKAEIKWLNDVYVNSKKCAGIILEGVFDLNGGEDNYIIVGIGVNVTTVDFPEEFSKRAGSVGALSRNALVAKVVNKLVKICENLESREYLEEYKRRCFVLKKTITVLKNDDTYTAFAEDIDDIARLIVVKENGEREVLYNEEVSTRYEQ